MAEFSHRYDPEARTFRLYGDRVMTSIHSVKDCVGRPCMIHNPDVEWIANVEDWDYLVRESGLIERLCSCGIGHPDRDDLWFRENVLKEDWWGVHGCCGHCTGKVYDEAVA